MIAHFSHIINIFAYLCLFGYSIWRLFVLQYIEVNITVIITTIIIIQLAGQPASIFQSNFRQHPQQQSDFSSINSKKDDEIGRNGTILLGPHRSGPYTGAASDGGIELPGQQLYNSGVEPDLEPIVLPSTGPHRNLDVNGEGVRNQHQQHPYHYSTGLEPVFEPIMPPSPEVFNGLFFALTGQLYMQPWATEVNPIPTAMVPVIKVP
jgi:hypothetical protein